MPITDSWEPRAVVATSEPLQQLRERITGVLLAVARTRSTITYSALAAMVGFDMARATDRRVLGEILDSIATWSYDDRLVVLAVLVVLQKENMPSGRMDASNPSGFYAWAKAQGFDISDPYKLVLREQGKVYNAFSV